MVNRKSKNSASHYALRTTAYALLALISFYQRLKRTLGFPHSCRFSPSCSEYMKIAISRHGMMRGTAIGIKRILRCHPWSAGGSDVVPR